MLVVAPAGLGTLNATALTTEALRARGLTCPGVVVGSWPAAPDLASRCNLDGPAGASAGAPLLGAVPAGAGALEPADFRAAGGGLAGAGARRELGRGAVDGGADARAVLGDAPGRPGEQSPGGEPSDSSVRPRRGGPIMLRRSAPVPRDAVHHPVFARFYARLSVAADLRAAWRTVGRSCSPGSPAGSSRSARATV